MKKVGKNGVSKTTSKRHNKAFKADSQRSAVLVANSSPVIKVALLSEVGRCSPLNAALCFIEPQQNQYINFNGKTQSDLEVFLF